MMGGMDDFSDTVERYRPEWAGSLGPQCRARLTRRDSPHAHGRCELVPHGPEVPHMRERGLEVLCWRVTVAIGGPSYQAGQPPEVWLPRGALGKGDGRG
jgi:hypothetical protein